MQKKMQKEIWQGKSKSIINKRANTIDHGLTDGVFLYLIRALNIDIRFRISPIILPGAPMPK